MPKSSNPSAGRRIVPRFKVWIEVDGSYVFGRGISDILKAIDQAGSIKQAAGLLGKSYRYVWNRVKEAEVALGSTLVETQVGGKDVHRSHLTDLGKTLVTEFDGLRERMGQVLDEEFAGRVPALGRPHSAPSKPAASPREP